MSNMVVRMIRDERGIIFRYMFTALFTAGILVFIVIQVGPLLWGRVTVINQAEELAQAVANEVTLTGDLQAGLDKGLAWARNMGFEGEDLDNVKFTWLPEDGQEKTGVRVEITKRVNTWLVRIIKPLASRSEIKVSREANFPRIR